MSWRVGRKNEKLIPDIVGAGACLELHESQRFKVTENVKFCKNIKCKNLFTLIRRYRGCLACQIVENVDKMLEKWSYG